MLDFNDSFDFFAYGLTTIMIVSVFSLIGWLLYSGVVCLKAKRAHFDTIYVSPDDAREKERRLLLICSRVHDNDDKADE